MDKQQAAREAFEKKVRGAIYNTWHRDGIANVDGVARIAVGAIWSDIKAALSQPSVTVEELAHFILLSTLPLAANAQGLEYCKKQWPNVWSDALCEAQAILAKYNVTVKG